MAAMDHVEGTTLGDDAKGGGTPRLSPAALGMWGVIFGVVLATRLAARRQPRSANIVSLDDVREKLGRIGARKNPLVDFEGMAD